MKLIIDIDGDYYNIIQKNGGSNYVEDAVLNGTPLDNIKTEIEEYLRNKNYSSYLVDAINNIFDKYIGKRSKNEKRMEKGQSINS